MDILKWHAFAWWIFENFKIIEIVFYNRTQIKQMNFGIPNMEREGGLRGRTQASGEFQDSFFKTDCSFFYLVITISYVYMFALKW